MTVAAKMRATPVNDFFSKNVRIREDGRVLRDVHLFLVKNPKLQSPVGPDDPG